MQAYEGKFSLFLVFILFLYFFFHQFLQQAVGVFENPILHQAGAVSNLVFP